ncbi:Nucleic acid-binding, OB-fold [Pseudocohnilembus persalinus]|uniref:Nucleic acid-binding, OB-fold n=1 Tax=Pseudocohnilembus persalinus TaxID=266149 RepID=A0A0V0R803_PSEPJ|nr:Nucleic acid-binding, OB-fold [Pseudocohnilembus persalinus]|eukprot:KRX10357.1 Nucleic acid-binding, OB-fold [Pseudocohnilembus persalinus]
MIESTQQNIQELINFDQFILGDYENVNIVLPGDLITSEQEYMEQNRFLIKLVYFQKMFYYFSGHGTFREQGKIYSSLVGTRIKTEQDELNMRQILSENDLACAEVHSFNQDKSINLHTRSLKYGRLENGMLVQVHNKLIKRQKHHFIQLDCGVNMIFSHNGMIWLSNVERHQIIKEEIQMQKKPYSKQERETMAYIANILKLFHDQQVQITAELLNKIYSYFKSKDISAGQLLSVQNQHLFVQFLKDEIEKKLPTEINKIVKQGDFLNN